MEIKKDVYIKWLKEFSAQVTPNFNQDTLSTVRAKLKEVDTTTLDALGVTLCALMTLIDEVPAVREYITEMDRRNIKATKDSNGVGISMDKNEASILLALHLVEHIAETYENGIISIEGMYS